VVQSLTWALECDRPHGRRSVLLQVLEVDLGEGRKMEAVRKSILRRGKLLRSGQQAGSILKREVIIKSEKSCKTEIEIVEEKLYFNIFLNCI